jgi:hypothetical protein
MSIYKKLAEAKKEIGKVSKNAKNPHFKNTYADVNALIEAVEPILLEKGLLLLQPIENGKVTSIIYEIEGTENVFSEIELPPLTDPQKLGSAITYFRRYTLQSLLSLQAEDDDANKASQPTQQAPTKKVFTSTDAQQHIAQKTPLAELMKTFDLTVEQQTKYTNAISK